MEYKLKILVIDDEVSLENIYTSFLQKIGAIVTFCDHPQKGWQAIDRNKYDLIITDLRMPAITGDEFITIVRNSKLNALTPIILSSAYINKLTITELNRASKVYFLTKPFDSKTLLELVDKAIGTKEKSIKDIGPQNDKWLKSFTDKMSSLTKGSIEIEKIEKFELWNFESVSVSFCILEDSNPIAVTLVMKIKSFLKIAGSIQGTQYKNLEQETLVIWENLLKDINKDTYKITFSKIISQEILLKPAQVPAFYKIIMGHEEVQVFQA